MRGKSHMGDNECVLEKMLILWMNLQFSDVRSLFPYSTKDSNSVSIKMMEIRQGDRLCITA